MSDHKLIDAIEELKNGQVCGVAIDTTEEVKLLDIYLSNRKEAFAALMINSLALSQICESIFGCGTDEVEKLIQEEKTKYVPYGATELADIAVKVYEIQDNLTKLRKKVMLCDNLKEETLAKDALEHIAEALELDEDEVEEILRRFKELDEADTETQI